MTVSPAFPVPLNVGEVSRVASPGLSGVPVGALSGLTVISGESGVAGATVSTTSVNEPEGVEVPAAFVATAVNTCVPSVSVLGGVKLQPPLPSSTAAPSSVVPS
ncbi:hypothetical protein D3C80_1143910 [compost metagenome]